MLTRGIRIYIAGPMTGLPEFNYPAFRDAEARLQAAGFEVESPHHNGDGDTSKPWQWYMRRAICQLVSCEAVALLPGWERSKGATLEHQIATSLAIDVRTLEGWL